MDNFDSHILVVDDDDGIRSLVKKYLNENNYLVTTANSAEDANEKISNDYINSLEHLQLLPPYNQIPAPTQAHTPPPASSPSNQRVF